jgi:hypothetical protein
VNHAEASTSSSRASEPDLYEEVVLLDRQQARSRTRFNTQERHAARRGRFVLLDCVERTKTCGP